MGGIASGLVGCDFFCVFLFWHWCVCFLEIGVSTLTLVCQHWYWCVNLDIGVLTLTLVCQPWHWCVNLDICIFNDMVLSVSCIFCLFLDIFCFLNSLSCSWNLVFFLTWVSFFLTWVSLFLTFLSYSWNGCLFLDICAFCSWHWCVFFHDIGVVFLGINVLLGCFVCEIPCKCGYLRKLC